MHAKSSSTPLLTAATRALPCAATTAHSPNGHPPQLPHRCMPIAWVNQLTRRQQLGLTVSADEDLLDEVGVCVLDAGVPGCGHLAAVLVGVALGDVEDDGLGDDGDGVVVGEHDELQRKRGQRRAGRGGAMSCCQEGDGLASRRAGAVCIQQGQQHM